MMVTLCLSALAVLLPAAHAAPIDFLAPQVSNAILCSPERLLRLLSTIHYPKTQATFSLNPTLNQTANPCTIHEMVEPSHNPLRLISCTSKPAVSDRAQCVMDSPTLSTPLHPAVGHATLQTPRTPGV